MSNDEWMTLQTYASAEEAQPLMELLRENQLTYQLVEDAHKTGDSLNLQLENRGISAFHVQVLSKDIDRASRILDLSAGKLVQEIEEDDYISKFSEEELLEILHKPDEWNQTDVQLALKFLRERGHEIPDDQVKEWFLQRLHDLERPEPPSTALLLLGYGFSLLGGIIGCMIAVQLLLSRKRLPDGRKILIYSSSARLHGRIMLGLSIMDMAGLVAYFSA
ncbi:MAG TPA: hypothetical protein VLM37_10350 [Fibrobacteraceae bacterium]|nr:hypothetical protein [Fibrobacteraceae bacterium]